MKLDEFDFNQPIEVILVVEVAKDDPVELLLDRKKFNNANDISNEYLSLENNISELFSNFGRTELDIHDINGDCVTLHESNLLRRPYFKYNQS